MSDEVLMSQDNSTTLLAYGAICGVFMSFGFMAMMYRRLSRRLDSIDARLSTIEGPRYSPIRDEAAIREKLVPISNSSAESSPAVDMSPNISDRDIDRLGLRVDAYEFRR